MLQVFHCDVVISRLELGLTRDKYSRAELRSLLRNRIDNLGWRVAGSYAIPLPIQPLIDDFSERLAAGAEQNIQRYFAIRGASGFTGGGRRAVSRPMRYTRGQLRPNNEDVGAIGEGIAGYYLEDIEGLQFEIRPFDISPDFIFRDSGSNVMILCEVKTSLEAWPRILLTNAIDLLDILAKTWLIRSRVYVAYIIQVKIQGPTEFELRRLKIEVT